MKKIFFTIPMMISCYTYAAGTADNNTRVGLAVGYSSGPYRDYDNKLLPLPLINYEGSVFYLRSAEAGLKVYSSEKDEIALLADFLPLHFKPGDSQHSEMKALNERKFSLMTGISWRHIDSWGITSISAKQRVTGNHEGKIYSLAYSYPILTGKTKWSFGGGIDYYDAKLNRNYFGITRDEAARSKLSSYNPGGGITPYVSTALTYSLTDSIDISAGIRLARMSNEIHESPMVDQRYLTSVASSVSYKF